MLRPGDVLMTEGGDLDKLGRGTVWKGEIPDCLHQNHIYAVRCFRHKLLPEFLASGDGFSVCPELFRGYWKTNDKPGHHQCNQGWLVADSAAVDRRTARHLQSLLTKDLPRSPAIVAGIEAQIATLTAYRKSLIHECVTGQRRITAADVAQVNR